MTIAQVHDFEEGSLEGDLFWEVSYNEEVLWRTARRRDAQVRRFGVAHVITQLRARSSGTAEAVLISAMMFQFAFAWLDTRGYGGMMSLVRGILAGLGGCY